MLTVCLYNRCKIRSKKIFCSIFNRVIITKQNISFTARHFTNFVHDKEYNVAYATKYSSSNEIVNEDGKAINPASDFINYRVIINNLIRSISEDENLLSQVASNCIDKPHWISFLNTYRRNLILSPEIIFNNDVKAFEKLQQMLLKIVNISQIKKQVDSEDEDLELLKKCKSFLFERCLQSATEEFKTMIEARKLLAGTSDLRSPHEWYPFSRMMKRKIIFHGGPTNSGKTYSALERLRKAPNSGLYCGPLRLLALEVYEKLNRQGVLTNLKTGQEIREVPGATHVCSTLEMVSICTEYDVAVIDEIQMIADRDRGDAWSRALLGLRAKEIHLCGGLEASNIVRSLAESTGDEFELVKYDRLAKLKVEDESLRGNYTKVRPGDCIVAFSKMDVFAIRDLIERKTKYKCAVIYGQLPPETRTTQARLFNESNTGYDILVATDAIGMGLNLNIRRIIFHNLMKKGQKSTNYCEPTSVKQIAGRAGRYSSNHSIGEVTTWQEADLAYLKAVMSWELPQISSAGISPSLDQIQFFSEQLNKTNAIVPPINPILDTNDDDDDERVDDENNDNNLDNVNNNNNNNNNPIIGLDVVLDMLNNDDNKNKNVDKNNHNLTNFAESNIPLSMILEKFVSLSQIDSRYFMCELRGKITAANWLHSIPLSLNDKFIFANAPVNLTDDFTMNALYRFAATYAQNRPVPLSVKLRTTIPTDLESFILLCSQHHTLDLYIWLSFRFPKYFIAQDYCMEQKEFAVKQIETALSNKRLLKNDEVQRLSLNGRFIKMRLDYKKFNNSLLPSRELV
eukprot:gene10534-14151_t